VVEARQRLGGRVLTQTCASTGQALDLGATWFWPDTEPRMAALLAELYIGHFPQYDPGDALWLTDPNRQPERREEPGGVHADAQRIEGGAGRLIDALAASLPEHCMHAASALRLLRDRGAYIELQVESAGRTRLLRARRVALALPPRLVQARIAFDPPLAAGLSAALADIPTWMAAQAKAAMTYPQPFWRAQGHSGQAFVRHAQAVLGEVFDASDEPTNAGALGGFFALDAAQRERFRRGMPLLVESQFAQLFGSEAQQGQQYLADWAQEAWTCTDADKAGPAEWPQADPLLRTAHWAERLFFGGSETALHGTGHMEGALDAAARIARALEAKQVQTHGGHEASAAEADDARSRFAAYVAACRAQAPAHYKQQLARLLSGQQQQLTQRALLATVGQVYSQVLVVLDQLLPTLQVEQSAAAQAGRHSLTPVLLASFQGWNKGLLTEALEFNAASCALSNFPDDHQPDDHLQRAIALDLAAAWREFALELNARLLAASEVMAVRPGVPA
ncbi:MAG TPA: FAD-dependent oxidoreductase, partial [Burkholderiaceae bacterium]